MRRSQFLLLPLLFSVAHALADDSPARSVSKRLHVRSPARIVTDKSGIPHIFAKSEIDMAYLQGYVHARDRLFQLDTLRRTADGTLAELLGPAALSSDVQLRTIGLRRAAERSLPLASKAVRAALTAYAAGINAYAKDNPLPPEYTPLELTQFRLWTEEDSMAVLKLAEFPTAALEDIDRTARFQTYRAAGAGAGFDGTTLFLQDLERAAPFDPASTIPDALLNSPRSRAATLSGVQNRDESTPDGVSNLTARLAREFMDALHEAPIAEGVLNASEGNRGSNSWVVSGRFSLSGTPLLASDPHGTHMQPSQFYQNHLQASAADIDVIGASVPGFPYIVIGNNQRITWGATAGLIDVIDVYQEKVEVDVNSPSGFSTVYEGKLEHIIPLPQVFRANTPGDGTKDNLTLAAGTTVPPAVLIVPRRNSGPILRLDRVNGTALSFQWTASSGTRGLDGFRGFALARGVHDFSRAVDNIDAGSQNFIVADTSGNIAYFLSGEVPLREDLQAGKISGLPPTLIRNGQGGNEWMRATTKDPTRALPFEIVPKAEMPRVVNPPRGFIVSANNDPVGATLDNDAFNQFRPNGGILYFGVAAYAPGIRAGRIDELLEERVKRRGRLTMQDMNDIQSDTVINDARVFTPSILKAFSNSKKPGSHPLLAQFATDARVVEAIARLDAWDQSTPTGIREGFDADDAPGRLREPDAEEIRHSVATTIYSVWRNEFLSDTLVDSLARYGLSLTTLRRDILGAARNLLDSFDKQQGVGASGIDFFQVPGVSDAATRRDIVLLRSLSSALDSLAGEKYASVFKGSTRQDDYRWGKLHRLVIEHPLGGPFNLPPAGGLFPSPLGADLPGIPMDGGMLGVDVANNTLLVDNPSGFLVKFGPNFRYLSRGRLLGNGFDAEVATPGGESGVPGTPFYLNQFEGWLTNKTVPLRQNAVELIGQSATVEIILPVSQ